MFDACTQKDCPLQDSLFKINATLLRGGVSLQRSLPIMSAMLPAAIPRGSRSVLIRQGRSEAFLPAWLHQKSFLQNSPDTEPQWPRNWSTLQENGASSTTSPSGASLSGSGSLVIATAFQSSFTASDGKTSEPLPSSLVVNDPAGTIWLPSPTIHT